MNPAARVTDMHTCPMVSPGPVPHVGGPILPPGAATVLVAGLPAARVGDMATCVGPPDSIVMGSLGVFAEGKPFARVGDPTAHGGVIVAGCLTVLVGDIGVTVTLLGSEDYQAGLQITGSPEFRKATKESLDTIKGTLTGTKILATLSSSGKQVIIEEFSGTNGTCTRDSDDANLRSDGSPGPGSGSTIRFNPEFTPGGIPNEVVLGHELIHAVDNAEGQRDIKLTKGVKNAELKTVGLPPFPGDGLTENSLREDLGVKKRIKY